MGSNKVLRDSKLF